MRKASHDGGDSTSITSGVENETKKSAMKPKKSSLKKKVPSFRQESDDTVNEPLLHRDKDTSEAQSAKYLVKGKTESLQNKDNDIKAKTTSTTTGFCGTTESLLSFKDSDTTKNTSAAPIHNYMNTNVFKTHDNVKTNVTTKSQILVEIDSTQQSGYNPSPLIFTTAKIHTDAKTKHMEPVHVTPAPILSTIEVSLSKGNIISNEKIISNGSSVVSPVYTPTPLSKSKEEKNAINHFNTILSPTSSKDVFAKQIPVTSVAKLSNNKATAQVSPTTNPSNASKSSSIICNSRDKQGDMKKDQTLTHTSKNNVTVKTITPSNIESTDVSTVTKMNPSDNTKIQKLEGGFDKNIKSPTSANNLVETTNAARNVSSTFGNKQLQRQKTATEDMSDTEAKIAPNINNLKDFSTKIPTSSYFKTNDGIDIKESAKTELPITSANVSRVNVTNISPATKSTVVSVTSSDTIESSRSISCTAMPTSTVENTMSTTSTSTLLNSSSLTDAILPSSIAVSISPAANVVETFETSTTKVKDIPVQQQSFIPKILPNTIPVTNTSISKTVPVSSVKAKTSSPTVEKNASVSITNASVTAPLLANSSSKTAVIKTPLVTTSSKTSSVSSVASNTTKPSVSSFQMSSPGLVSSVKNPTVSAPKTSSTVVLTTSQNVASTPNSSNKQTISTVSANTTAKTSTVTSKPPSVNSSVAAIATGIKSPNDNTSQTIGASKPLNTSNPKTDTATTLSKTSAGTSSANSSKTSATKTSQSSTPATTTSKESVTSSKKPGLTKTSSIITKTPMTSAKPIAGSTTKTSITDASSTSVPANKKTSATSIPKVSSVTTSPKTPLGSSAKTSVVNSASSSITSKLTTADSSNSKSVGIAGSTVTSSTSALRPSESIKKGGSKSSENNKGGKVSKA